MAVNFDIFSSPDFQNKWAYSDRSQQSLGLDDETWNYFKNSNFQPYQPTADTNIQKIDGNWMNTVVQPGQTPKDFQPVTSTPVTGGQTAYGANIATSLPQTGLGGAIGQTSILEASPLSGGLGSVLKPPTQTAGAAPTDNGGIFGTGTYKPNPNILANPVPPLPGDPVGEPGYYPGKPATGQTGASNPYVPPTPPPSSTPPPSAPPTPPNGGQYPLPPGTESRFFPDDPQSRYDNGLGLPRTSIRPEDVMLDPGYKWQKEQLDRMLEDRFAAKGRVGSTDYFNAGRAQDLDLVSREYNRINNQQWDRGMEMNRLLYDRRVQEDYTSYEREFRENERKYGREKAEEILAYERAWRTDAREYDRYRYLVELGFGATNSSSGT